MNKKRGKDTIKNVAGLLTIPPAAVVVVFGIVAPGFAHKTFDLWIAACMGAAVLTQAAGLKLKFRFMPLFPTIFYAVALGLIAYHSAPIVMDMINNLNFLDGNWTTVKVQIALSVVICIFSVFTCFVQGDVSNERDAVNKETIGRKGDAIGGGNAI